MIAWGKKRSPATYLDAINANGAAVMMGNAWGDTIFPPNQYASFYDKLTGPKRLEFRPGDHATAELTGLFGLPNDTWTNTRRWFDRYLKGERNGIDTEQPVQLKSRTDKGYEGYPDWKSVGAAQNRIPLDGTKKVWANVDSGANGGITLLSNALDQFLKLRRWSPYRCCRARSRACGSPSGTGPSSASGGRRGCTPRSPARNRAAPSSRTSTTWGRSASASW